MYGFAGETSRAEELATELHRLLAVFPRYIAKPITPTWFDPDEVRRNEQFDAILRAHKKDRLALPIAALQATGSTYHNFSWMHLRRLAWFVPSLLSTWLEEVPTPSDPFARTTNAVFTIERILGDTAIVERHDWKWTSEEEAALASFFDAALRAALATPLETSAGRAVETLRVAAAMHIPVTPLVEAWMNERTELAEEQLLAALTGQPWDARRLLVHEKTVGRLRDAFFGANGLRAARLSDAEALVSSWLSQQPP